MHRPVLVYLHSENIAQSDFCVHCSAIVYLFCLHAVNLVDVLESDAFVFMVFEL